MKNDYTLPVSATTITKKEISDSTAFAFAFAFVFARGRYKFWALTALLLLAFCSMLTGTVTLRWSVGNFNHLSDEFDVLNSDDLDVLELEERAVVVNHMWDLYTNSRRIRLPRFWQDAFVSAYEYLTSDDSAVREAAVSEIAKMSLRSFNLDSPLPPPPPPAPDIQQLPLQSNEEEEDEEVQQQQQQEGMGKNERRKRRSSKEKEGSSL